jgi:hypothetical protein
MNNCQVYLHVKPETNEPFYVGRGVPGRSHSYASRSKRWRNVVGKYGLKVIILEDNLTEEESHDKEKYWIAKYGRLDLGTGPLVNMTSGEDYSDTRAKNISRALNGLTRKPHSEKTKLKIGQSHRGMKRSAETKSNISKSKIGKGVPMSEEQKEIRKAMTWYTNGQDTVRLLSDDTIPEGYYKGRPVDESLKEERTCSYCLTTFTVSSKKPKRFCSVSCGLKNRYNNGN